MNDRELQFFKYLDGEMSASEFAEFRAWINAAPEHARELAKLSLLNVHLREKLRFEELLDPLTQIPTSAEAPRRRFQLLSSLVEPRRRTAVSFAIAAVILGVLIIPLAFVTAPFYRRLEAPAVDAAPLFVAQITAVHEAQWAEGQAFAPSGKRLRLGKRLKLREGLAEILFDSGAKVVLNGPADFTIDSINSGDLEVGKITAQVPADAKGFAIETPAARIVDLGTEFVVEVEPLGDTEVGVEVGAVELQTQDSSIVRRVLAGQVALINGSGIAVRKGSIGNRFARYFPGQQQGTIVLQDAVEDDGSWQLSGSDGIFDGTGFGQINRAAIQGEVALGMIGLEDDGGSKTFTSVKLQAGVYVVVFWMGNYNSAPFPLAMSVELSTEKQPLADLLVHANKPVPESGNWARWTLTYEVPPGDPRIGESLRFAIHDGGGQGNAAFDSLRVWHTPSASPNNESKPSQAPLDAS